MLLNLSNHPSNKWIDKQTEVACQLYGSVTDLSFPQIAPNNTTQQVQQLAQDLLQTAGIVCIASTTDRNTIDNPDGSKTLQFNFCQFRNYPQLTYAQ